MSTTVATVRTRSRTRVSVWARSTVYVARDMKRIFQEVAEVRGLTADYLFDYGDIIIKGFDYWITGRYLQHAYLEVIAPETGELVERHVLTPEYDLSNRDDVEFFETDIETVKDALSRAPALRPGCRYQIVVMLAAGAPGLPGWGPAPNRDDSHLRRLDMGPVIRTAKITVGMSYWGNWEP